MKKKKLIKSNDSHDLEAAWISIDVDENTKDNHSARPVHYTTPLNGDFNWDTQDHVLNQFQHQKNNKSIHNINNTNSLDNNNTNTTMMNEDLSLNNSTISNNNNNNNKKGKLSFF